MSPQRTLAAVLAVLAVAAAGCVGDDGVTGPLTTDAPTGTVAPGAAPIDEPPPSVAPTRPPASVFDAVCAGTVSVTVAGSLPDELDEVSGVAAGRSTPERLWAVEDSGNRAVLYGFDPSGGNVQAVDVEGALNIDWEDVAVGPDAGGSESVWIADTGDNLRFRPSVSLLYFAEPTAGATAVRPERITATFDDGPRDAEALVVAPSGIWLFEKTDRGASGIYRLDEDVSVFRRVGEIDVRPALVTGADLSPDGGTLALRTNRDVRLYPVRDGDLVGAVASPECRAPEPPEVQGESITFSAAGDALFTVSERGRGGSSVDLHVTRAP